MWISISICVITVILYLFVSLWVDKSFDFPEATIINVVILFCLSFISATLMTLL